MQVVLIKATAKRTATGLVDEAEEVLGVLPENADEYFNCLTEMLAEEVIQSAATHQKSA